MLVNSKNIQVFHPPSLGDLVLDDDFEQVFVVLRTILWEEYPSFINLEIVGLSPSGKILHRFFYEEEV